MKRWLPLFLATCLACASEVSSSEAETSGPSTGSSTGGDGGSTDESTGSGQSEESEETGEPPGCDEEALAACIAQADAALPSCLAACGDPPSCDALTCAPACRADHVGLMRDCGETHCPEAPPDQPDCRAACMEGASECFGGLDCMPQTCEFTAGQCEWLCGGCGAIPLSYEYEGSCTLTLPPGIDPQLLPFLRVIFGDASYEAGEEGEPPCSEPPIGASVEGLEGDQLVLCPEQCASFEELGLLQVEVFHPCGP